MLLFDQNLSPTLVDRLSDIYPEASHTSYEDLGTSKDRDIWTFAREHDYIIVTKDSDFNSLLALKGPPPKVIWIRTGNCTTDTIERLLRENADEIHELSENREQELLELQ